MLVKICGMTRQVDLDCAAQAGVNFCGFIFHPGSPRYISPAQAADLNSHAMKRTGVFVANDANEILRIMEEARLDYAQLHGNQDKEVARAIGPERVFRVLWPEGHASLDALLEKANSFADSCYCFLLDAGKSGGGSGRALSWRKLKHLKLPRPWFLSGGLDNERIGQALSKCSPDGLDFNSGLEDAAGIKNPERIKNLMRMLHAKNFLSGSQV